MDFAGDFAAAQQSVTEELVATTRTLSRIAAQDLSFYRSSDPSLAASLDLKSARLLDLTQKLLNRAGSSANSKPLRLPDADAVDTRWRRIVDTADGLFERADMCLDEFSGLIKNKHVSDQSQQPISEPIAQKPRLLHTLRDAQVPKPQLRFQSKPPNHKKGPFKPLLTSKPNATTSLGDCLEQRSEEDGLCQYQHPYYDEIDQYKWSSQVLHQAPPTDYRPFDSTRGTFIDTFEGVQGMLEELKSADIIAIDLEHHDTHSYFGIVSLMQISTRDHDWIVDTLKPWRHRLEVLNEVFTDPKILKVLHGAQMDVIWLQRDFGLYLVGLFDTHHASRVLLYPGGSLAFLLKKFIGFDAQKQYQMADWRIRPLPNEMLDYARSDTHFLIHIFEHMRNELLSSSGVGSSGLGPLEDVLGRCKETALQRFEYPLLSNDIESRHNAWASMLIRNPTEMTSEQVSIFAGAFQWRDRVAREEDEGIHYVLPNMALFAIAKSVPTTKAELFAIVHNVSPILRQRADDLIATIDRSKAAGDGGPDTKAIFMKFPFTGRRPRRQQQDRATPHTSDSATPRDINTKPAGHALRAGTSSFWGATAPFEPRTADITSFKDSQLFVVMRPPMGVSTNESMNVQSKKSADSLDLEMTDPSNVDLPADVDAPIVGVEVTDDADDFVSDSKDREALRVVEKRAKRKAEKARKRARQDGDVSSVDGPRAGTDPPGFDYDGAASILHAKKSPRTAQGPQKKPFNPYAKAENASGGLKRAQEPRAGKSFTYR